MRRGQPTLRQRRHRRRRHLPDRLHLGHHRPAQGHDAFPPRRDGRLRLLAAPCAARAARRRVHRQPAAGLHLRPGRPAAVPDDASAPPACWSRRPRPTRCRRRSRSYRATRLLHRADRRTARWPAASGDARPVAACANASRPARRCPRRRAAVEARPPASRSSTASARPRCCTSSSRPTEEQARGGATGYAVPGYQAPRARTTTASRCRRARSAAWRCKGPTGCQYLADERQTNYVQDGWNLTGDAYLIDADG